MKNNKLIYVLILAAIVCVTSCRKEEEIVPSTSLQVVYPDPNPGEIKGFFLLNEGNMGNNKATLDYFDYETGVYTKNIYAERNPGVVKSSAMWAMICRYTAAVCMPSSTAPISSK